MEIWQIFGLVGIINLLVAILSFGWGYTVGGLEMIKTMLEVTAEEEEKEVNND